jgi:transposase-like protein
MSRYFDVKRGEIRYSEAFKLEVVRELEREGRPFEEVRRKYGIGGCDTVQNWVRRYGNGTRGKVIRVERPEEISEVQRLRERTRRLENALADASMDLALEREYTRLACKRAGIEDVEAFKKNNAGRQSKES